MLNPVGRKINASDDNANVNKCSLIFNKFRMMPLGVKMFPFKISTVNHFHLFTVPGKHISKYEGIFSMINILDIYSKYVFF